MGVGFLDKVTDMSVGFVERTANTVAGFGKSLIVEPSLFAWDLAKAPWTDDDYETFWGTVGGSFMEHTANGLGATFGPDQGLGAAIGGMPGWSRGAVNSTFTGLEWANKELVNQPLATLVTMASIADAPGHEDGGFSAWWSGDKWRQAYNIADTRSLGQAMFFAVMTENIFSEREIERAKDSGYYRWTTGFIDAVTVLRFDPLTLVAKSISTARAGGGGPLGAIWARGAATAAVGPKAAFAKGVTTEDAARMGNMQIRLGFTQRQKMDSFRETIADVRSREVPDATNIFQLYINASKPSRKALRLETKTLSHPRMQAEGGRILDQVNLWLNSSRRVDVDSYIRASYDDILVKAGRTAETAIDDDTLALSAVIRKTVMNEEKATGGIGTITDVLARAYAKHGEDTKLIDQTWRALTGDRGALTEMHVILQRENQIRGGLLRMKGEVTLADMLERYILSGTPRRTVSDFSQDSDIIQFIIANEDVFPQEIMAEIIQEALLIGNDDLVKTLLQLTDSIDELKSLRNVQAAAAPGRAALRDTPRMQRARQRQIQKLDRQVEVYLRRANMHSDEIGAKFDDPITRGIRPQTMQEGVAGPGAPGWNQARIEALIEETGSNDVMRSLFAARGRVVRESADLLGESPRLRFEPRVTIPSKIRWSGVTQNGPLGRVVHAATRMTPNRFIDLNSDKLSVQAVRVMQSSHIPPDEQLVLRGALDAAESVPRRQMVWETIENRMFETLAQKHELSVDDIQEVLANVNVRKHLAYRKLKQSNMRYDSTNTHSVLEFDDGKTLWQTPVLATQNSKFVAIPDYRSLDRAVRRRRDIIGRYHKADIEGAAAGGREVDLLAATKKAVVRHDDQFMNVAGRWTMDGMEGIMKFWVPSALLRPAWVAKVVLVDERIRQMAQFGGMISWMDQMKITHNSMHNLYRALAEDSNPIMRLLGVDKGLTTNKAIRNAGATGALFGMAVGGPVGMVAGAAMGAGLNARMLKRFKGVEAALPWDMARVVDGHTIQNVAGNGIDGRNMWAEQVSVSSGNTWKTLMGHVDGTDVELRAVRGSYQSVTSANTAKWDAAMDDTFNQIMGQDPLVARFVRDIADDIDAGADVDNVRYLNNLADRWAEWLKNDPAGRRYSEQVRFRTYSDQAKEAYSDGVREMIYRYLQVDGKMGHTLARERNTDLLRQLIDPKKARVTPKEWRAQFDNPDALPSIHGQEVLETLGAESAVGRKWGNFVERAWKLLGEFPADTLSRQPMFDNLYQLEMRRLIRTFRQEVNKSGITEAQLYGLERSAKEYALSQTRHVLYELGENSEFGEAMRMIMPFFGAYQEALTRYAGLAYENPAFFARALNAWDSDVFDTDDEGNEYLTFRIPVWAKALADDSVFFTGAFDNVETISFSKNSINMLGNGLPGLGPIVQFPLGKAMQEDPELELALETFFPYGPPKDVFDAFLPAWARRARSLGEGESNRSFAVMMRQTLKTAIVKMEVGDEDWVDLNDPIARREFLRGVEKDTKALMGIRMIASMISPTATTFRSPYNELIEIYRDLQETTSNADEVFLREYGEDYFALTQATTRTVNGMPPTLHGVHTQDKFGPLINSYPELGGIIAGSDGGGTFGQFLRGMYNSQIADGDREMIPLDEMAVLPQVRVGWIKYSRFMDFIEWQRVEADLPNLRVKEAQHIAEVRKNFVHSLTNTNPAWAADFFDSDRGKWDRRIEGLRAIAATPGLGQADGETFGRRDLEPLQDYLNMRDWVLAELEARRLDGDSATLDSMENQDLVLVWETFTNDLVEQNLAWADLFHRYLDNDPMRRPLTGFTNIFAISANL